MLDRIGPTGQPMRGLPGFPGQQPGQSRTTPLGSGRLQNGKISVYFIETDQVTSKINVYRHL